MPTVVNGLPAHVLLAHLVVVFVPATALLLILAVAWPAARERIGIFGPGIALVTLIFVPITTNAGEWFKNEKFPDSFPALEDHARLGSSMIYYSAGAFVLFAAWWLVSNSSGVKLLAKVPALASFGTNKFVRIGIGVVAVVVAVLSLIHGVQVGDSGAKAVWDGVIS